VKFLQFSFKIVLIAVYISAVVFFIGCAPPVEKKMLSCPGAGSLDESIQRLKANSQNIVSFRGNGKCQSVFYDDGRRYRENFSVKIWAEPPSDLRLQGDIFFDPKGIVLGSNSEEFWFSIKPRLSTYVWGVWSEQDTASAGLINPATLLEAFGAPKITDRHKWKLSNDKVFDILTKTNDKGKPVKKIYIYCCDYLIRRIEYYGKDGKITLIAKLDEYIKADNNFFLPGLIEMVTFDRKGNENSFKMSFDDFKAVEFTDRQKRALFARPEPRGFNNVYRIIKGDAVEQTK